jgi:SPP1 gp7 family putative phage head morphogenesis protein
MAENLSTTLADDAKAHTINLLRIEAGMRMEVVGMLDSLEKDLLKQLASTDLTTAKKERLQAFLDQTSAQVSSAYKQIADVGEANLEKVATISSKQVAKSIDAGVGVNIGTVLSPQQLTRIAKGPIVEGSPMADWWAGQDLAAQRRFKGAIQQGLLLGEDMASIQRRIRGSKASGFTDGALSVSKREAQALTSTAVQSVNNQARIDTLMENDDVVKGIEWVATLDARTTKTCMALDGKQWRLPDLKPIGHDKAFPGPVAHWGCRSTQGPVTYSWAELAGKKLKKKEGAPTFQEAFQKRLEQQGFTPEEAAKIEAKQRASMDGQVSDSKDWQAWLTGKGDAFALEKLGPGRFALWKQGKLTLTDLTDQQGRELTLAELEAAIDGGTIPPETEGRDFKPANAAASYTAAQEAAATLAVQQQQQGEAAAKLAEYKATKEGQTLKNKWALKVEGELGQATDSEKVAWVEAKAAEEQAAKSKASVLSTAKKKLVAGEAATPAQLKLIDSLTPEEKANFDEAVADAKANAVGTVVADIKAELAKSDGQPTAALVGSLNNLQAKFPEAFEDVKAYAQGLQAEKSAGDELQAILSKGHPLEIDGVTSAKGATNVEMLADAKHKATIYANEALIDIAKKPEGQTLKHKALAEALNVPTAQLKADGSSLVTFASEEPIELLKKVEAVAAEKQAQASLAAKISGAKKKWMAGEEFTLAQKTAWEQLTPDQQAEYLDTWGQLKAKAVAVDPDDAAGKWFADMLNANPADGTATGAQGGQTVTAPDVTATGPKNQDLLIPDPAGLVKLKDLSGSTKPYLAQDPVTGKKWVVKDSSKGGGGVDHFQSEALADAIYRAAGANVPGSGVVLTGGKAIKVAEFLEGGQTLGEWKQGKSATEVAAMHRKLQDGFVTDALLANWDVAGLGNDNILVTADGTPVRIDNGGSLFFRAQGGKKPLPPEIAEMQTLRDPGLNPNTAQIFAGLTQDQINGQISDLVARKEAILAAAAPDPKVQKALKARLEWLEKQLPAAAKKTPSTTLAPASAPGQIPANVGELLERGRNGAGTALVGDGDAIEDQQIVVWREKTPQGESVVKLEADLTLAGSDRIMKTLADAGMDTATKGGSNSNPYVQPKPAGMHPKDDFWPQLEAAAKTVSTHAADGQYNVATLATYDTAKAAILKLANDPATAADPQAMAMLKHYADAVAKIDAAKAAGKALVKGELGSYKVPPGWTPPTTAKAKAPGDVEIDGWTVTRLDRFDFTVKEVKGGVLTDTGVVNRTADHGRIFRLTKGPVEVTVLAYREDAASTPTKRSMQGTLRVTVRGNDDPAAIEAGLQAVAKLGIDTKPPSDAQKELLYLHKGVVMRRNNTDTAYTGILNNSALSDEAKVNAVKDWAEKKYGVTLPREKGKWGDDYNPEGYMPSNATGYRQWTRWDVPAKERDKLLKTKVLYHSTSDVERTFLAWVENAGNTTTTMERLRTGVPLSGTGGASSDSDINRGGGDFLYTNTTTKAKAEKLQGFVFKGRNIARLDLRSDVSDSYGAWEYANSRRGELQEIAAQNGISISVNSGLLKNGLNLFDELETLNTGNATRRASIISKLKAMGFAEWPDGRKLEDVIK